MTRYSFNNYEDLKVAVVKHIQTSDKHIILEGKGNNGKSVLIRDLRTLITDYNFDIRNHPGNTYEDLTIDESESEYESDEEDDMVEIPQFTPGEQKELKISQKSIIHTNTPINDLPYSITYYFDFSFNESDPIPPHIHNIINGIRGLYRCRFGCYSNNN